MWPHRQVVEIVRVLDGNRVPQLPSTPSQKLGPSRHYSNAKHLSFSTQFKNKCRKALACHGLLLTQLSARMFAACIDHVNVPRRVRQRNGRRTILDWCVCREYPVGFPQKSLRPRKCFAPRYMGCAGGVCVWFHLGLRFESLRGILGGGKRGMREK
jgi:hypothetical protein